MHPLHPRPPAPQDIDRARPCLVPPAASVTPQARSRLEDGRPRPACNSARRVLNARHASCHLSSPRLHHRRGHCLVRGASPERTQGIWPASRAEGHVWTPRGFTGDSLERGLTAGRSLESGRARGSCFRRGDGRLGGTAQGRPGHHCPRRVSDSVAWCACAPWTRRHPRRRGRRLLVGFALLRADAKALGGPLARRWLDFSPGAWAPGGDECGEATLDGWIGDHHAPAASSGPTGLALPARRRALSKARPRGPRRGATHGRSRIPRRAGRVVSASSRWARPGEALSLRVTGGARPREGAAPSAGARPPRRRRSAGGAFPGHHHRVLPTCSERSCSGCATRSRPRPSSRARRRRGLGRRPRRPRVVAARSPIEFVHANEREEQG